MSRRASSRAESFSLHQRRLVTEIDKSAGYYFDERRRTANENARSVACRPANLGEHRAVNAAMKACPAGWRVSSQSMDDFERRILGGQGSELVAINHFIPGAR